MRRLYRNSIHSYISNFNSRGVSETLGVLLLLAMIVMGTGALAITGSDMITQLQDNSEVDQTHNAFAKLGSSSTSVALGDNTSRAEVDLGLGIESNNQKNLGVENTGHIEIYLKNTSNGSTQTLAEEDLGELRYTNTKNKQESQAMRFALQNGGVWRGQGNGSSMATPPESHYEDATLTLPLISVTGDENINSDEVTIRKSKTTFPTNHVAITEEEEIRIKIQSPYYIAWESYFQNRLPGTLGTETHASNNTTIVKLGRDEVFPKTFDSALLGTGSISMNKGNPTVDGDLKTTGTCSSCSSKVSGTITENYEFEGQDSDSFVQSKVNALKSNGTNITVSSGDTLDDGKYYTENLNPGGDITVDVSDGDVILGVENDVNIEDRVAIVGADEADSGNFSVYVSDDVTLVTGSAEWVVTDGNVTHSQLYGTSNSQITINQKATFEGLIYAPTSSTSGSPGGGGGGGGPGGGGGGPGGAACGSTNVCIGQNTEVTGAVVAGSMEVGQGANVEYSSDFADFTPSAKSDLEFRPRIVYLHISINEITVEESE